MTRVELVQEVAERLNLTSQKALDRILRSLNIRYRQVASSVGMRDIVRTTLAVLTVPHDQSITFGGVEKVYRVFDTRLTPYQILDQITPDEMAHRVIGVDPPRAWCVSNLSPATALTVQITLDVIPDTAFSMGAECDAYLSDLASDSDIPRIPSSFHDILIYGAMATELDKMEKYEFAKKQEAMFNIRLADLRYYIAKSAYLDIHQGKSAPSNVFSSIV